MIHGQNGVPIYRVLPQADWNEPEWAQKGRAHPEKTWEAGRLFRFAESSDGTELIIQLFSPERKNKGAAFVGRRRDGESGQKVARPFTDFLLRVLDGGSEAFFQRAGFVPLA